MTTDQERGRASPGPAWHRGGPGMAAALRRDLERPKTRREPRAVGMSLCRHVSQSLLGSACPGGHQGLQRTPLGIHPGAW